MISDFAPSQEAVLDLNPDFVYAGWESNLTADTAGDRDKLASLGIGSYVSPSACKEPGYQPEKLTFDGLFDEITEAGQVFGAEQAADDLVTEQRAELDAVTPSTAGLTALWYSSGTDTPYVGAGIGAPEMMLEAAGLTNVAADVKDTWSSLGWEAIIDANPDVIVLVDADWNTAASKIEHAHVEPGDRAAARRRQQAVHRGAVRRERGGSSERRGRAVHRRPAGRPEPQLNGCRQPRADDPDRS